MRTEAPSPPLPYVVGIGASAGGLQALEAFFDQLPRHSGLAFVIVQHLSPDFRSVMDELLARHTETPIRHAEDGMPVEADHVYLNPPGKDMIIAGGKLLLSERGRHHERSLPIDVFFRSLAQDCGPRAIAVVLSGGGSDGSRGIRDVREAGGLVVIQDVESAQFDGMPKTAKDAGVAHWVVPPEEMSKVIVDHAREAHGQALRDKANLPVEGVDGIYKMLETDFGIDFTHYKPSTVTRRIERRLQLSHSSNLGEYLERLRGRRDELDALYRDLLIGVTRFFRNEDAFEVLERKVLPEQIARTPTDAAFRVWVPGCATGEEAYSLAIVLQELAPLLGRRPVKIFATDVHRGSLEIAARGLYDARSVEHVRRDRLERYFQPRGDHWQVLPELRQNVVFAPQNVIKDAPFTHIDLVSCRNMLIYLKPAAQQKALSMFHFALNRGGLAFLGPSESTGPFGREFDTIDAHHRMYRKRSDARVEVDPRFRPSVHRIDASFPAPQTTSSVGRPSQLLGTYDALLEQFMPPGLLVTERGELVHTFGGASRFLRPRDGRHTTDLLELVEPDLKMILVGGLQRARRERASITFPNVAINESKGEKARFRVTVRPLLGRGGTVPHLVVTFEEEDGPPRSVETGTEVDVGEASRDRIVGLEAELSHAKENLQAAIEELETSNEELQAANEELIASNEELQSTNEELQSVNEELYTVNAEYQRKIAELTELTNDVDNLFSSIDIGTMFLDADLKIRKFTPQIAETFNLLPQDVTRSIETFTHNLHHGDFMADLRRVQQTGEPIEREVRDRKERPFYLRILPYRAKGGVGGAVVTLLDISGLKAAEDALFHERYLFDSLLSSVPDAIYFKNAAGQILRINQAMALRFGLSDPRQAIGKTLFELPAQTTASALQRKDEAVLRSGQPDLYKVEKRGDGEDGEEWDIVTRLPLVDASGAVVGTVGIFRDFTDRKRTEAQNREAVRRRDEFLAMLSHELRNPLSAIMTATSLLQSDAPSKGEVVQLLERQATQMARLLDDLLEATRVTQNKIELRKSRVNLRTVLRDAVDVVRPLLASRGLTFHVDIDGEPLMVDGDPARLQQIQVNLLTNAAKYTPRGGRVSLVAKRVGDRAQVVVSDNGVGIAKPMLANVFDLFVQSPRTLDRSEGGLGVGLTLARALTTMHGGTLEVASDGEGAGTTFTFQVPIQTVDDVAPPSVRKRDFGLDGGAYVLLVEDNEDARDLLCRCLTRAGLECHAVGDGVAALDSIERRVPDAAVLDLGLPGMDGLELARHLRADPRLARTALVALTGYGTPDDRARALEAGFDEHLVKPVVPSELLGLLMGQTVRV